MLLKWYTFMRINARVPHRGTSLSIYDDSYIPVLRSFVACTGLPMRVPRWGTDSSMAASRSLNKKRACTLDKTKEYTLDKAKECTLDKTKACTLGKTKEYTLDKAKEYILGKTKEYTLDKAKEYTLDETFQMTQDRCFQVLLIDSPNGAEAWVTPVKRR